MAPPCGDAAAAAELTSMRISEGAALPPLPGRYRPFFYSLSDSLTKAFNRGFWGVFWVCWRRRSVGGNAGEREEEGDTNKKARKEKAGMQRIAGWGLREFSKIGEMSRLAEIPFAACLLDRACR